MLTDKVSCDEVKIKRIINYSTELGMLTKLKNNNLITEIDFDKIKKKIMQQYSVISELSI